MHSSTSAITPLGEPPSPPVSGIQNPANLPKNLTKTTQLPNHQCCNTPSDGTFFHAIVKAATSASTQILSSTLDPLLRFHALLSHIVCSLASCVSLACVRASGRSSGWAPARRAVEGGTGRSRGWTWRRPRASRVGTPMSAFGHVPSVYYRVDCSLKDRSTQQVVHASSTFVWRSPAILWESLACQRRLNGRVARCERPAAAA